MLPCLGDSNEEFPPTSSALDSPNGLLAFGGDLNPERLLHAYARGIFPWYEEGQPILWWTPDPRMVLYPDELHVSRSVRRSNKKLEAAGCRVTFNTRFAQVMDGCAAHREGAEGTWITEAMKAGYIQLNQMGYAVSVEVLNKDNQLVGGLYGIALGKVFYGESMFSRVSGASKLAFVALASTLKSRDYKVIDCQVSSEYLAGFGARDVSRTEFESSLETRGTIPAPDSSWHSLQEKTDMS